MKKISNTAYDSARKALGIVIQKSSYHPNRLSVAFIDTSRINITDDDYPSMSHIFKELNTIANRVVSAEELLEQFKYSPTDKNTFAAIDYWYNQKFEERTGENLQMFLKHHFDILTGRKSEFEDISITVEIGEIADEEETR